MSEVKGVKMGSLVLGNKATAPGATLDKETERYRRGWKIQVDKISRFNEEMREAEAIWDEVKNYDYKELKAKALEKQRKKDASSYGPEKSETKQKQLQAAKTALYNRQHGQQETQQANGEIRLDQMTAEEQYHAMLNR